MTTVVESRRARREALRAREASRPDDIRRERREALVRADRLGVLPASWLRRSSAYALDVLCYLIVVSPAITGLVLLITGANWARPGLSVFTADTGTLIALIVTLAGMVLGWVFIIVEIALHGTKGTTVGKALAGVRSVGVVSMKKPGFWRIVLRAVILLGSHLGLPFLGPLLFLLSPLWSERGIGWLDRVSHSHAVDVRLGLNPYDLKALKRAERRIARPERVVESTLPSLATSAPEAGMFTPGERSRLSVVGENVMLPPGETPLTPSPQPVSVAASTPMPAAPEGASSDPVSFGGADTRVPEQPHEGTIMRAPNRVFALVGSGTQISLGGGPVLIGRNPSPVEGENADTVAVSDETYSLSKTHALVGSDRNRVWVEDRGSANGTSIVQEDGSTLPVEPFIRTVVQGVGIRCGECEFTVSVREGEQ